MIDYKIKDKALPGRSILSGFIGELYEKVIERRMCSELAVKSILAEAEEPFFSRCDDSSAPVGFWKGEFWGKWIVSAVRACKYKKNDELADIIRRSVDKILMTADPSGYVGTYTNPKLILPCDPLESVRAVGFPSDFCWNIWCQKYTLWGLIESYELFDDKKILTAATRLADQLIDTVHEIGAHPCETGTFFGVASGSIMKPILILYRHTGDKKLLDFAVEIADGFENDETKCIKIIKKALSDIPPHTWNYDNPLAKGHTRYTSQKAYEMMSCFEGICELYRLVGDEKYLTAAKKFFDLLIKYEYNRLFSVGYTDRFLFAASVEDAASEVCDMIHFMRLAAELYKISRDVRYIDYYESTFMNPFLASITRDGSWSAFSVRSMSHHVSDSNVIGMKYNHCCVNNMPRGFEGFSEMMICKSEDTVYVNMYAPASADLGDLKITVHDGYIKRCKTELSYTAKKPILLKLRIPEWSRCTSVEYGEHVFSPSAGTYLDLMVDAGCGSVHISFDNTPQVFEASYERSIFPITPYLKMRYDLKMPAECLTINKATVRIGPTLMAMSTRLGTTWDEMIKEETVNGVYRSCTAAPIDAEGTLAAYSVTFETDGGARTVPMCDYISASNGFTENSFSIFV